MILDKIDRVAIPDLISGLVNKTSPGDIRWVRTTAVTGTGYPWYQAHHDRSQCSLAAARSPELKYGDIWIFRQESWGKMRFSIQPVK